MLKQSSGRMKKVLAILLTILFVISVTSVAASAHYGGWGRGGWLWLGPGWGYRTGCMWVGGDNWLCPGFNFTSGMPYTIQTTKPAAPAPAAPDLGPDAGLAIFPKKAST